MWDEVLASIGPEPAQISLEEYRARQNRLLNQLRPDDLLIIPNPAHSTRSNDVEYPYRTSSDMIYLCGWTDLDSTMVAQQVNGAWEVTLFVQPKDVLSEIWEGRRLGKEGALENFAIDRAESKDDLEIVLIDMINSSKRILVKSAVDTTIDEIVNNCITAQSRDRQKLGIGPISVEDPSGRISELRLRKSATEIDLMRYSAVVASHAHIEAMKNTKPGVGEWQLEGIIEGFFKYGKTSGIAYPCIIGSGDNATILHYTVNDDICEDGEILLIDAGCEYKGYASDITRSWPVNGKFSTSQAEIYQIVLDSQLAAIDACRIGNPYDLPHKIAREVLAQGLIDLGVISQNLEEALDPTDGELRFWYMHNTGHWIGLDVHDVGVYRPDNEARLLEEGMVLTVEPGLYFGAWRPDVNCPEKYANIGIRIEDDVLVTKDGPDVLSKNCPKTIEELEGIIGE